MCKRKLLTVAWHKVCKPLSEGGLGIRSVSKVNDAANLKLCMELFNSSKQWARLLRSRVLRKNSYIQYHVPSSIWCGIKSNFHILVENSTWILGNGSKIRFWTDAWCGPPLVEQLHIPQIAQTGLQSKVEDFILDFRWNLPPAILILFSNIVDILNQVHIPLSPRDDELRWIHSHNGNLSLKDAYQFKSPPSNTLSWAKLIWKYFIPPSKSLFVWKLILSKVLTDAILAKRGIHMFPLRCDLCGTQEETIDHIFWHCSFAQNLWQWLARATDLDIQINLLEIWDACSHTSSKQTGVVILSAIINILNIIWSSRNQKKFNNKSIHWKSALNMIISSVNMTGNSAKVSSACNIKDFRILKAFKVKVRPPNVGRIVEIIRRPPLLSWIKCNTDGMSLGVPGHAACGGIFRDENLGESFALNAEFIGVMRAIELAFDRN